MVEPEIYEFLAWVTEVADSFGLVVLPEVHDGYATHERLSAPRLLDVRLRPAGPAAARVRDRRATRLRDAPCPVAERQFTNLDCHDGIPVRPDLDGILTPAEMAGLADPGPGAGRQREPNPVRRPCRGGRCAPAQLHVLLGPRRRRRALSSPRARSSSSRAASRRSTTSGCWPARTTTTAVERTGEGRAINRHDYTPDEIRGRARSARGQARPRAGPPSEHAPGVRRRAPRRRRRSLAATRLGSGGERPGPGGGLRCGKRSPHRSQRCSIDRGLDDIAPIRGDVI